MSTQPPAFGPTEIIGDDEHTPHAIVVLAVALPHEQLRAALAIGHGQMAGEPPLEDMSADDVRREVEGYLGACAVVELDRETDSINERLAPEHAAALNTAIDHAYTRPAPAPRQQQDPRYGNGTVTLQTKDHGEVVLPEPAWCIGHDDDQVGYLADVTHNGRPVRADASTRRYGLAEVMEARITQAPHAVIQPEPQPLLSIRIDVDMKVAPDDGRKLAQALRLASLRLDRALNEVARLRGERL
ncbi:hypothetical protein ACFC08_35630 [Streptomyces sp. NPDC056112]|uniref:DUF6907 domain-containing protein n=1 Tax=Streptomyces sp. NPDC056112 TaxID=3345715 RepID=UPI0035D661CE